MRTKTTTMIVVGLVFLAAGTNLWAATITVTSDSGGTGGPDCTVRDAITAANTDTATGGCPAGSGADVIELPAGVKITLPNVYDSGFGGTGLPPVSSEITINGNGATIRRNSGTGRFRIFLIEDPGNLLLDNLTVAGGFPAQFDGGPIGYTGGRILNLGGKLELTHCTVSGNEASTGGGIYNLEGTLTMTNSTVSGNEGGGIFNDGGELTLTNSIVANSSSGADCETWDVGVNDNGFNIVEDGSCGFPAAGDPNLGPLADNGGPTQTHALLTGSIAIDEIPLENCEMDSDQRGIPRPQGTHCDIGSYEYELEVCPADFDGDGAVNAADLAQFLGSWGPYEPCPPYDAADFNQDCGVTAADLAQLLGSWGQCE